MNPAEKFQKLKDRHDRLKTKADRLDGAIAETMTTLERDFSVKTIEEAQELLESLNTKVERLERKFKKAVTTFEKEYTDVLSRDAR